MSTPVAAGTLSTSSPAAPRVLARRWRRRLAALGESTPATVGIVIVLAWVVLAVLAPPIAPYPPNANDMAALAPTPTKAPIIARIVRGMTLDLREREYVAAAKMRGESALYIMLVEILPNARGPLVVDMCLRTGYNVIIIGALGFLGIGLPPPDPDWGGMGHDTYGMMMVWAHMALVPCAAISSLVVGFNLLAVGLRELGLRD